MNGILHLNISADNVLLNESDLKVKLTDFAVSLELNENDNNISLDSNFEG